MYENTLKIACATQPYFCAKYRDKDSSLQLKCDRCWNMHVVARPNHGLCHSVRQGLLAVRIATLINLKCDLYKLQAAAAFQRSGRQSEVSSTKNTALYQSYEEQDVQNFLAFIPDEEYSQALPWSAETNIARVLHAAHHLDLRRIPFFDEQRIKQNVRDLLLISEAEVHKLWCYAGRLLHACGDRCLCCDKKTYSPIFARLSNCPQDLVQVLLAVK